MIKTTPIYVTALLLLALFPDAYAAEAVQKQATSGAVPAAAPIAEDSGTWRRKPYMVTIKKSGALPATAGKKLPMGDTLSKQLYDDNIQLQGIMQVGNSFHALINGLSVKVGDLVEGVTVKEISRYRVVLLNEQKEQIVYDIYQGRINRGKQ